MTETEISQAKARARDVVLGFARIREQQACDVLALADALQEANRKLREVETIGDWPLPKGFDQIFGDLSGGKRA